MDTNIKMTQPMPTKNFILYADDDKDDLELVREAFEKNSRNVGLVTFEDGDSVLSYLLSRAHLDPAPCLIILDINLPIMDGKEVLKKLRTITKYRETPVILFTTSSQPQDKAFARQYNAGFMTKPLSYQQMDLITEKFIERCTDEIKNNMKNQLL
jgi:CheY-like chemotaxis protein